jgi:ABC-type bacteriocin/lantibiotic exporter with double-glycine peptidase domain
MLIYSWLLTLVALATIPFFVLLTVLVAPIVRQATAGQSRTQCLKPSPSGRSAVGHSNREGPKY